MAIGDLLPLLLPTVAIVAAAAWMTIRDRSADVAFDLRDVPRVQRASIVTPVGSSRPPGPVRGALVEPGAKSLGARMRSLPDAASPKAPRTPAAPPRRVSRRRRPLVAGGRTAPR